MLGDQMGGQNVVIGVPKEGALRLFLLYVFVWAAFPLHYAGSMGSGHPCESR